MKIISGILILITAFLSLKHGWEGLAATQKPGEPDMMAALGIGKNMGYALGVISIAIGIMVLFPQTFFVANLVNALVIVLIMALALRAGVVKTALMEIPFLVIPLVLIYLGHPLKK
jgi:hypothetical protein